MNIFWYGNFLHFWKCILCDFFAVFKISMYRQNFGRNVVNAICVKKFSEALVSDFTMTLDPLFTRKLQSCERKYFFRTFEIHRFSHWIFNQYQKSHSSPSMRKASQNLFKSSLAMKCTKQNQSSKRTTNIIKTFVYYTCALSHFFQSVAQFFSSPQMLENSYDAVYSEWPTKKWYESFLAKNTRGRLSNIFILLRNGNKNRGCIDSRLKNVSLVFHTNAFFQKKPNLPKL